MESGGTVRLRHQASYGPSILLHMAIYSRSVPYSSRALVMSIQYHPDFSSVTSSTAHSPSASASLSVSQNLAWSVPCRQ